MAGTGMAPVLAAGGHAVAHPSPVPSEGHTPKSVRIGEPIPEHDASHARVRG
jgi:hypothetical protein